MYQRYQSARSGYRGQNGRNSSRGGARRIKSFDPSYLINTPTQVIAEKEYLVVNSFADFKISEHLKKNIVKRGYTTPTPIQDQAIPHILEGRDLIGMASTGTGKTAAFLIPLIDKVLKDRNHKVLIITPTRELADQIKQEFYEFSNGMYIFSALCIGGVGMGRQIMDLRRNPNFVIGTPGRLKDLIRNNVLNLSHFNSIVLDEADHMVDVGFIGEIKYFISLMPPKRHSLFFSATINDKVKEILSTFVKDPVTVSVKTGGGIENVDQQIVRISNSQNKVDALTNILKQKECNKVLIFGRTKHGVQQLSEKLSSFGFRTDAIHGNKKQSQRARVLSNFKNNHLNILIATDVAARGLDIPNVSHVINYDLPESRDAYIHRIGRTGRAGNRGFALTFITDLEKTPRVARGMN